MKFLIAFSLAAASLFGQGALSPVPIQQPLSNSGQILIGACLYTYATGSTTPLATYSNATLTSANTNPIVLDASGRAPAIFLSPVSYKFVLAQKFLNACPATPGTVLWSQDPVFDTGLLLKAQLALITGANLIGFEPTGGSVATTVGAALNSAFLYDIGYSSLSSACAAAVSAGKVLALTNSWDLNGTCAASIYAYRGGIIKPASGHTATLTGSLDGALTQHFDVSSGGIFASTSAFSMKAMYPQYWGATGNGTTDDTTALTNAYANLRALNQTTLTVPPGRYKITSKVAVPNGAVTSCQSNTTVPGVTTRAFFFAGSDSITMFGNTYDAVNGNFSIEFHGCGFDGQSTASFTATDGIFLDTVAFFKVDDNLFQNFPADHAAIKAGGILEGEMNGNLFTGTPGRGMDIQKSYSSSSGPYYGVNVGEFRNNRCSTCSQGYRVSGQFKWDTNLVEGDLASSARAAFDFAEFGINSYVDAFGDNYAETTGLGTNQYIYFINGGVLNIRGSQMVFTGTGSICVGVDNLADGISLFALNISGNVLRACSVGLYVNKSPSQSSSIQGGITVDAANLWQNNQATITDATNASPSVLTVPSHSYKNGTPIFISGALGNTAINGSVIVQNVSGSTFTLTNLAGDAINGNGTYTASSGTVSKAALVLGSNIQVSDVVQNPYPMRIEVPNYGVLTSQSSPNASKSFITALETATSANNALVITAPTAALGVNPCIQINALAHTLQAGANTLVLNGGSSHPIKSQQDTGADIPTAYASNSSFYACYNSLVSRWQIH